MVNGNSLNHSVKILLLTLALSLFSGVAKASTDREFRKSVIENCDEAKRLLLELNIEEKSEVVSYLVLVAKMEAPLLQEPIPTRGNDFFGVVDPDRERRAKHCALTLIENLGIQSISALPQLIEIAADKRFSLVDSSLDAELENLIIKKINLLADDKEKKITGKKQIAISIVPLLQTNQSELALRALKVLDKDGIEALFKAIKIPVSKQRQAIFKGLIAIDQSGEVTGKELLTLLHSEDEDLRIKTVTTLGEMPNFAATSVSPLVKKLSDISNAVQEKAAFALSNLASKLEPTHEIGIDDETARAIVQAAYRMQGDSQKYVADSIVRFGKGSKAIVETLISGYSPLLSVSTQKIILKLLGRLSNLPEKGFKILSQSLTSDDLSVRISAIEGLSYQNKKLSEVVALYNKTIQKSAKTEREKTIIAIAEAINRLELKDSNSPLLKQMIDSLGVVENEAISKAILTLATSNPQNVAKKLLPLISSDKAKVRIVVRDTLVSLGEAVRPEVSKLLGTKNAKFFAAEIMYVLGDRSKNVTALFVKGFQEASCSEKVSLFSRFVKKDNQDYSFIAEQFVNCLNAPDAALRQAVINKLLMLTPLNQQISQNLSNYVVSEQTDPSLKFMILDRVNEFSLPKEQIFQHVLSLLNDSDSSIKYRAAGIIGKLGAGANPAIPKLLEMLNDNENGELLKHQLVVAITLIDPNAYNYKKFFAEQLSDENIEWTKRSLNELGKERALEILTPVIEDANHPYRNNAKACIKEFE